MPTGYTADIEKGITFQKFALTCAQAFGACISMRDDPIGTPIPDEFQPSTYNADRLRECRERIAQIESMTTDECAKEADKEYLGAVEYRQKRIEEKRELRRKYKAMLSAVMDWTPPSADHVGLRDFMREQIETSIRFDCIESAPRMFRQKSGEEWRRLELERLREDAARHQEEQRKENERVAGRNRWVRQLRESLK